MPVVYSIRDWNATFEVAQSRKIDGPHSWVAMPTKHDGKCFRKIMARTDGLVVFAAWVLIVQVAAKCQPRGQLADSDGPLTAADLNLKTGCPTEAFETALQVLSSKDFRWIVVEEWEESPATGQDSTEQDKESASADSSAELGRNGQSADSEFVFPVTGKGPKEWALSKAKFDEYVAAYPSFDVANELRKARQWCRDNERQRKTAGGMAAFLTRWMNKAQNFGRGKGQPDPPKSEYREITPEQFKIHKDNDEFMTRPLRDNKNPNRWFGQLRSTRKVETFVKPMPTNADGDC
jgi:hypothetical protein